MIRLPALIVVCGLLSLPAAADRLPDAPVAKRVPFQETVQGIVVNDPYRWMEAGGEEYTAWLRGQAEAADRWLSALPQRAALLRAIGERSGSLEAVGKVERRAGKVFVQRRLVGAQTAQLLVRDALTAPERLLFDPGSLDTESVKGHAINYWSASPDGRHLFLGVSAGGTEEARMMVMEVASGQFVDGSAEKALFNGGSEFGGLYPQWLPDSSGFFYNRLAENAVAGQPGYFLNTRLFVHRLGQPMTADRLLLQRGLPDAPEMKESEAPIVTAHPSSSMAVLLLGDGVDRALRLFKAPLADAVAGTATWQPFVERSAQVEGYAVLGDHIYLLRRDVARGRVMRLGANAKSLAEAREVVPESASVLEAVVPSAEGLYLVSRGAKGSELRVLKPNDTVQAVNLPITGSLFLYDGSATEQGVLVSLENYVTPRRRLLVTGGQASETPLGAKTSFATDDYLAETVLVKARDGTEVPLDLLRRRDLPKDGKRPVLLEAYGAYGLNVDAYFNPRLLPLLDAGIMLATAHVRGGGELGREWQKAGFKETKPNTWRDAIDCALWLQKSGWTSGRRITVWGTSAGGIMAGRAVTEQPELWAGAVASVGVMNTMRVEFTPNGPTNVQEFGSVATPEGAKALRAMDAYLSIQPGRRYPPMLLTAGANDPRVISWQPGKFAAALQAARTRGPVVFKTDFDMGHGMGSMRSQLDTKTADIGAFTLWAASRAR